MNTTPRDIPRLWQQILAEFLGTGILVAVVIGSGIMAERLSPSDTGLQLVENSIATALGLTAIILIFHTVSGSHINPVVTLADAALRPRPGRGRQVAGYLPAQVAGAIGGALLATAMFSEPVELSTTTRLSPATALGEVVATAGLVLLIFALVRTNRAGIVAPAVGAYIGSAYWFTSSTSFANPAVTIGRVFTDTFAGIDPASAVAFVGAQLVGAALGALLILALFPRTQRKSTLGLPSRLE